MSKLGRTLVAILPNSMIPEDFFYNIKFLRLISAKKNKKEKKKYSSWSLRTLSSVEGVNIKLKTKEISDYAQECFLAGLVSFPSQTSDAPGERVVEYFLGRLGSRTRNSQRHWGFCCRRAKT